MALNEFLEEWYGPSTEVQVHTSGSTGTPKKMWVEKEKMMNSARLTCDFLGLQQGDTALLCMSTDFIAGKMMVVRSICRQLRLYSVEPSGHPLKDDPECQCIDFRQTEEQGRHSFPQAKKALQPPFYTLVAMVPMQVYNSLQVPKEAEALRATRHLLIGGGAIDEELARQLNDFPHAVWSSYAMTETLSHIALRRINGPEATDWYSPFPSVDLRLNEKGCLVINAPLVHDGELVTHDLAEIRADGCFRILGRLDNVINSGGIKIQIEEVEKRLNPHLRAPFMITSVRDAKFGQAVVLLTEGDDIEEAVAICRQVLPKYWIPKHCLHVDHLPLTPTGKPARAEAERMAAELLPNSR
jgi:O-succinylbenzoic acid--CoA ligase